ncbi:MAG: dependent ligase domain [Chthoniobacter sp.]|jgi:hypothetical protein|nr:dependent ligase domain [Chthoniobacter sp.]
MMNEMIPTQVVMLRSGKAPALMSFPARPIEGGRLELAPPKRGVWYAEPKLNGWRAIVHTPTGAMWNRYGARLSIAGCFQPALKRLRVLAERGLIWADCEALQRRHHLGRGTLVVLDMMPETGTPTYVERRTWLESFLALEPLYAGDLSSGVRVATDTVLLVPNLHAQSHEEALAFYGRLRECNLTLGCEFFEGVVMKQAQAPYPLQLRNPSEGYRGWQKHRWA